ncbi:MAG: hypothetical protein Q4E41_07085 [Bacteroidales bacterium]|nr:hypothetical protein [Muribaculaceae bacterium]MDO4971840.1 hypothetical protein [Bacteroidales bacterium]
MYKTILIVATIFALSACSGSTPAPSGDAEKDAKAILEYTMDGIESCNTLKELEKFNDESKSVMQDFEKYAESHSKYQEKLMLEIIKEAPKCQEAMEKKMKEIISEKR